MPPGTPGFISWKPKYQSKTQQKKSELCGKSWAVSLPLTWGWSSGPACVGLTLCPRPALSIREAPPHGERCACWQVCALVLGWWPPRALGTKCRHVRSCPNNIFSAGDGTGVHLLKSHFPSRESMGHPSWGLLASVQQCRPPKGYASLWGGGHQPPRGDAGLQGGMLASKEGNTSLQEGTPASGGDAACLSRRHGEQTDRQRSLPPGRPLCSLRWPETSVTAI